MGKFKFLVKIPAKPANPAKKQEQQRASSAKPLLNFAKMQTESMGSPASLANFSKSLASQNATAPKHLAGLAGLATFEGGSQTPPPDLSKIRPEHRSEYTDLWHRACELENYTSGDAPYQDRAARMPELNELVERMRVLEDKTKTAPTRQVKDKPIPGLPDDLFQAPAVWKIDASQPDRNQCFACHGRSWWRKNEPGSKWICGRCHPPVRGLDVIFRD